MCHMYQIWIANSSYILPAVTNSLSFGSSQVGISPCPPFLSAMKSKAHCALGYETILTLAVKLVDKIATADSFETFIRLRVNHAID